jgi:hypothetical protein
LTIAAQRAGVELFTGAAAVEVDRMDNGYVITLKTGRQIVCDHLLLATGSSLQGYAIARALGHHIEPPVPSLFTFNIADAKLRALAGVSIDPVRLRLVPPDPAILSKADKKALDQKGSVLITHWGLSGPAVLKLSAWGARLLHACGYRANLFIDWLPHLNLEQVRQTLITAREEVPKRVIANHSPCQLPRRLWDYLTERAEIPTEKRWADISKKEIEQLAIALTKSEFAIAGKGVFKDEFVTCGGVRLDEVNFQTMGSKLCPGLYFAGEILDIDGITGGFNFQSAWTTAWLAAQAMGLPVD